MEISYTTKEESNQAQRAAFLKLSHTERFSSWLNLMYQSKQIVASKAPENDNFIITIQTI
jgi:hypothetical protein